MGFEIVERGQFGNFAAPIETGQCSLAKSGKLTLLASDLEDAKIGPHYAIVLADRDNFRVALRGVRDGEQSTSVAITIVKTGSGADSGRRAVNMMRAVKRLGLTVEAIVGRYELLSKGEPGAELLIVNLSQATKQDLAKAAESDRRSKERAAQEKSRRGKGAAS